MTSVITMGERLKPQLAEPGVCFSKEVKNVLPFSAVYAPLAIPGAAAEKDSRARNPVRVPDASAEKRFTESPFELRPKEVPAEPAPNCCSVTVMNPFPGTTDPAGKRYFKGCDRSSDNHHPEISTGSALGLYN